MARRHHHRQHTEELRCVGSSCISSSAGSFCHLDDDPWSALMKAVGEATVTLKEVINNLKDGGTPTDSKQVFGATKRPPVMMKTIVARLTKVSTQLLSLQTQIRDLKDRATAFEKKMRNQDDSVDFVKKVDDLASTMQETLKRLQEDEKKNRMTCSSKDPKKVSFNISKASRSRDPDLEHDGIDIEKLAANEEQMRTENERLKKELEVALASLQSEASALEQVERYKEVIARVTADNMVFLMKLKESEQALNVAQEQQTKLMKQLETSKLNVLQEVSIEIEETVLASLSKVETCEKELQLLQKDHEVKEREWQQKLQEARNNSYQTKIITDRLKELEEERLQILAKLESESKAKEEAETKVDNLLHDVHILNEQLLKLKADHMQEIEDVQEKVKKVKLREQEMDELILTLDRTTAQLETQQAINVVLMKKKEEMEWLFLEAKAEKENLQKHCRSLIHN